MTVFSALAYLPQWAKYTLVPYFARFLWWLVWVRICAVAHFFHRRAVKQGACLCWCSNCCKSAKVGDRIWAVASADDVSAQLQEVHVCLSSMIKLSTPDPDWQRLEDLNPKSARHRMPS